MVSRRNSNETGRKTFESLADIGGIVNMNKLIIDEFTDLRVSRQRKWQLRRQKEGLCPRCGGLKGEAEMCAPCMLLKHNRRAKRLRSKKESL